MRFLEFTKNNSTQQIKIKKIKVLKNKEDI